MQKKIFILSAIFLVLAAAILFFTLKPAVSNGDDIGSGKSPQSQKIEQETTIRNVTDKTVYYTVEFVGRADEPEERVLEVGAIDRFPGTFDIDVTFIKDGEPETYNLDGGMPYSFRYDENDLLELYEGSHGREDAEDLAPFVPTPMVVVERMLELAEVNANSVLYDLGCGDGRIVVQAAKKYGARGIGIDIDPIRIEESNENAKREGVDSLVEFRLGDVMKVDLSEATVITLYLLPESNEILRPLLEKFLKEGAFVVTHNYYIPGWSEKEITVETVYTDDGEEHDIYLYKK
ncbi:MAG: class I SAM-dependent methyltransferase [Candidatus Aminicenantes bacterium]|nr:class I SAM-dependent methyltransferase [Candidatus Aminicenantes bacterium]